MSKRVSKLGAIKPVVRFPSQNLTGHTGKQEDVEFEQEVNKRLNYQPCGGGRRVLRKPIRGN